MIFKEIIHNIKEADWEEIPQEEIWEDGELNTVQVQHKIVSHVIQEGDWILVRRLHDII
jgi:hypothetical protein